MVFVMNCQAGPKPEWSNDLYDRRVRSRSKR